VHLDHVQASADQSTLDVWLAFFYGAALAIYFSLFGAIVVMCQTAWPIVLIMIPLAGVYFLYQVVLKPYTLNPNPGFWSFIWKVCLTRSFAER
jgi:hypothetical protein